MWSCLPKVSLPHLHFTSNLTEILLFSKDGAQRKVITARHRCRDGWMEGLNMRFTALWSASEPELDFPPKAAKSPGEKQENEMSEVTDWHFWPNLLMNSQFPMTFITNNFLKMTHICCAVSTDSLRDAVTWEELWKISSWNNSRTDLSSVKRLRLPLSALNAADAGPGRDLMLPRQNGSSCASAKFVG